MVQISSDYIMTEGRINIALGQNCKLMLLFNPGERELFLIVYSDWDRKEYMFQNNGFIPSSRGHINLL